MIEAKKIQQLDFNLLKVFECLYQERNMSLAAKVLFISPSAVSHAIKRLRTALDDDLFVRQGQLMQPTPACQRMAPQLLDVLEKLRQVLQACGDFDLAKTGQTFKLTTHDALEPLILPKLQRVLIEEAPRAKLTCSKLVREDMARLLSTNQIDLAIDVALPIKAPIKHLCVSRDDFCILLDKNHPQAKALNKEQYLAAKHIAVSNRASGAVVEDFALLQQGINRPVNIRCQSYLAAKELLKGAEHLLTLPSLIASKLLDNELIMLPVPLSLPMISTHMYWHKNTEHDEAQLWLREKVQSLFNESLQANK